MNTGSGLLGAGRIYSRSRRLESEASEAFEVVGSWMAEEGGENGFRRMIGWMAICVSSIV